MHVHVYIHACTCTHSYVASVPGLPRYAVLLASVRAGHTENGEGLPRFSALHGRTINVRNNNGETRNGEGLEPRLLVCTCPVRLIVLSSTHMLPCWSSCANLVWTLLEQVSQDRGTASSSNPHQDIRCGLLQQRQPQQLHS